MKNWKIKKLGDLCDLMTGGTPSKNKPEYFRNGTIKWLVSGDVHKKEIYDCEGRITEAGVQNSNAKYLPINSVIIALNGQGKTRGAVAMLRAKATCNQSLVSIYPKNIKELLPEYIFLNLEGRYEEIRKITGDDENDRRGLNMPLIRNINIPFAPIDEQKRIVTFLNELTVTIDRAKAIVEKDLQSAKELFESYLQNTFTNIKEDLIEEKMVEVCSILTCGLASTPKYVDENNGVPFLSAQNVKNGVVVLDKYKFISKELHEKLTKKNKPTKGDILYSRVGAKYGEAGVVEHDFEFSVYVSLTLIRAIPEKLNSYYLKYYLNSPLIKSLAKKSISSSGVPNLNVNDVREFPVRYPSLSKQEEVVRKIEVLLSETKRLESNYQQKLTNLEELKKTIFHKTFTGELTANSALKEGLLEMV